MPFPDFLRYTGKCKENPHGAHRWVDRQWIDEHKVWFQRCARCGAVCIWRVTTDAIYYDGQILSWSHKDPRFDPSSAQKLLLAVLKEVGGVEEKTRKETS